MERTVSPILLALCFVAGLPLHAADSPVKVEAKGLHNVFRVADNLYSGNSPDDAEAFRTLRDLGIKTIVSVDGARPDVEKARAFGLRYVHVPVGYDGITQNQALQLAKAVRDLPGPVYLHCHHGKHRGPAAAAAVVYCLDPKSTVAQVKQIMEKAGTDPRYTGLLQAPAKLTRPTPADLDRAPADFPSAVPPAGLKGHMVAVDAHWDHLLQVRAAGWKTPPAHPDVDPPHEALQLAEHYREAARLPLTVSARRPASLPRELRQAAEGAEALERVLRAKTIDAVAAEAAFRQAAQACTHCHARSRDLPRSASIPR